MKPNTTNSDLDEHKYFIGFFLIIIFILFLRSPEIILKGRFWGEEGLVYFKYAYEHNPFATLFFIDFRCGYYYFSATVSALLASLVPLEFAPFVSTLCSFFVTVLIIYAIYFTPSHLLKNKFLKIVFCLYLVIGSQAVAEVYCNSINTQVYWGIFGVLALFFDYDTLNREKSKKYVPTQKLLNGMLVIACLSGLYCVILFPFFILKYFLQKNQNSLKQIKCMIIPFILQISVVFYSKFFQGLASSKMTLNKFDFENIIYSLQHQFLQPLFGMKSARNFSVSSLIFCIVTFVMIYLTNLYLYRNNKNRIIQYVLLMVLYMYYLIYIQIGALGAGGAGGRYCFIPGCIIYLILLISIWGIYKKIANSKKILLVAIFIPLLIGGYDFQNPTNFKYLYYSEYAGAPNWKLEVEKFRNDNSYELKCWPYQKEWNLELIEK